MPESAPQESVMDGLRQLEVQGEAHLPCAILIPLGHPKGLTGQGVGVCRPDSVSASQRVCLQARGGVCRPKCVSAGLTWGIIVSEGQVQRTMPQCLGHGQALADLHTAVAHHMCCPGQVEG